MSGLVLLGLSLAYGRTAVLRDVDLELAAGRTLALVGPSGCGKTTLLRIVAGFVRPDAGRVEIGGRPVLDLPPERRGAVLMVQDHLLFPHMTVAENVGFGLRMRGLGGREIARRTAAMLERVRLAGLGDRRPDQISGGQAQRVALARALVVEPAVLLLDEPLSSLDPALRAEMRAVIRAVLAETGTTAVFVTHDRDEAYEMGEAVAVMLDGRIVQSGRPEDLHERPASVAAARFLGAGALIEGRVTADGFACGLGLIPLPGRPEPGPATLVARPEAICLGGPFEGRLIDGAYRGAVRRLTVEAAGILLTLDAEAAGILLTLDAEAAAAAGLAAGDPVRFGFRTERLWAIPQRVSA